MSDYELTKLARRIHRLEQFREGSARAQQVHRTVIGGSTVGDQLARVDDVGEQIDGMGEVVAGLVESDALALDAIVSPPMLADDTAAWDAHLTATDLRVTMEEHAARLTEAQDAIEERAAALDETLRTAADSREAVAEDLRKEQSRVDETFEVAEGAEGLAHSALTMAGTKTTVLYSLVEPPADGPFAEGTVWRRQATAAEITAGEASRGDVIQEWVREVGVWAETKVSSQIISNLDVGKLTVGSGVISDLVAQHIAAQSGKFIELGVDQLTVSGDAKMGQAVIEKLWAEAVVAKFLTATEKIITKDVIAAGAVTASAISAGAIDGMVVTGATVRTAATGQRMQMDGNGITLFNESGQKIMDLAPGRNGLVVTPDPNGIYTTLTGLRPDGLSVEDVDFGQISQFGSNGWYISNIPDPLTNHKYITQAEPYRTMMRHVSHTNEDGVNVEHLVQTSVSYETPEVSVTSESDLGSASAYLNVHVPRGNSIPPYSTVSADRTRTGLIYHHTGKPIKVLNPLVFWNDTDWMPAYLLTGWVSPSGWGLKYRMKQGFLQFSGRIQRSTGSAIGATWSQVTAADSTLAAAGVANIIKRTLMNHTTEGAFVINADGSISIAGDGTTFAANTEYLL